VSRRAPEDRSATGSPSGFAIHDAPGSARIRPGQSTHPILARR